MDSPNLIKPIPPDQAAEPQDVTQVEATAVGMLYLVMRNNGAISQPLAITETEAEAAALCSAGDPTWKHDIFGLPLTRVRPTARIIVPRR